MSQGHRAQDLPCRLLGGSGVVMGLGFRVVIGL